MKDLRSPWIQDAVSDKRVGVTENTEGFIIMLLMSVCQYDLVCQRFRTDIIAGPTFRRPCPFVHN